MTRMSNTHRRADDPAGYVRALAGVALASGVSLLLLVAPLARADEVDRRVAGLLRERAEKLFEQEKLKEALQRVELALALEDQPRSKLLQARILLAQGDCDAALPILRALDPKAFPRRERALAERRILEGRIACGDVRGKLGRAGKMIRLGGEPFVMGDGLRGETDERPAHQVSRPAFGGATPGCRPRRTRTGPSRLR